MFYNPDSVSQFALNHTVAMSILDVPEDVQEVLLSAFQLLSREHLTSSVVQALFNWYAAGNMMVALLFIAFYIQSR